MASHRKRSRSPSSGRRKKRGRSPSGGGRVSLMLRKALEPCFTVSVNIKTPNGKCVPLEVNTTDTLRDFKRKCGEGFKTSTPLTLAIHIPDEDLDVRALAGQTVYVLPTYATTDAINET